MHFIFKMVVACETRTKQRALIEFLSAEQETISNIHRRLQNVYDDQTVDRNTVDRWVTSVSIRMRWKQDNQISPRDAETPETVQRANMLIWEHRRVTTKQLDAQVGISVGSANTIIHRLGYSKICANC